MVSEHQINEILDKMFGNLDFPARPAGLYDPLRYIMDLGGKRVRPRLCLTVYSLFKDSFGPEITGPAVGLEVFHNFTLLHDDIMDASPKRRGKASVWAKWGETTAILSGDVMCIDSYRRICQAPRAVLGDVLDLFNRTTALVCEGQQMDMDFEQADMVSMDSYLKMTGLKTGVLLACAAQMGALIAGASGDDCRHLYDYGYKLGLAFQIADDYLDTYGDEKIFGKPIGGDIVNGKKTWLVVRALEKADPALRTALLDALGSKVSSREECEAKIERVRNIYNSLHIDEDAKYAIISQTSEALDSARDVCVGVRYEMLRRFADKLTGRTN